MLERVSSSAGSGAGESLREKSAGDGSDAAQPASWHTAQLDRVKAELATSQRAMRPERLEFFTQALAMVEQQDVSRGSPLRSMLAHVGSRWGGPLLLTLSLGPLRFGSLRRIMERGPDNAITQRMLTLSLRALERDGLVARTVHEGAVKRVEYMLTPLGEELVDRIWTLLQWFKEHAGEIEAARARFEEMKSADH